MALAARVGTALKRGRWVIDRDASEITQPSNQGPSVTLAEIRDAVGLVVAGITMLPVVTSTEGAIKHDVRITYQDELDPIYSVCFGAEPILVEPGVLASNLHGVPRERGRADDAKHTTELLPDGIGGSLPS